MMWFQHCLQGKIFICVYLQTAFLHHLEPFWCCSTWAGARLLLSYFWVMPASLAYGWVTSFPLHMPDAIQHLSTWHHIKISVPGRQSSHAGSAFPLAHLAPLFNREEEYSSVLSCRQWPLCAYVFHSRLCLQSTRLCSNSSSTHKQDLLTI